MSKLRTLLSPSFYRGLPDRLIRHTVWYRNIFEDYFRIRRIDQHQDIINLGSNPAKFGLDYSDCDVRGFNLAVGPQTVEYDLNMLKNYHSYLDERGPKLLLLVLFCPFSLCKDFYTERDGAVFRDLRYYPILHHAMIREYDESVYQLWVRHPARLLLKDWKVWGRILTARKNCRLELAVNPLNEQEMQRSADDFVAGWKREFCLRDFDVRHLSEEVERALVYNSSVLDEIVSFCAERGIRPVFVLPPVAHHITDQIPDDFKEYCMYSILRNKPVPLLDYTEDERFVKTEYFVNALCLNKTGRRNFTAQVIADLKQRKIL